MACKQEEVKVVTVETRWKKDAKGADLDPVQKQMSQKVPNGINISSNDPMELQAGVDAITKKKESLAKTEPSKVCGKESGCTFFAAGKQEGQWEDAEIKVDFQSPTHGTHFKDIPFTIQVKVTIVTGTCVDLW